MIARGPHGGGAAATPHGIAAPATAVIACGALAVHVRQIAARRGWAVDVVPVAAMLHNRPERIAPAIHDQLVRLRVRYERVAVAYADCGTYGALDDALEGTGVRRLSGEHCYDLFASEHVRAALAEEPGTYFLTDFLARTFAHTVLRQLGLDRHPELRDDYFGAYTRVLWLAQHATAATRAAAEAAAASIGLPLQVREVGDERLERELEELLTSATATATAQP